MTAGAAVPVGIAFAAAASALLVPAGTVAAGMTLGQDTSQMITPGVKAMQDVGAVLFPAEGKEGTERTDRFHLFGDGGMSLAPAGQGPKVTFEKIFFSPLRRTQATAVEIFGDIALQKGIAFHACPYCHEQRKSQSDVGLNKRELVGFSQCMNQAHFSPPSGPPRGA